MDRPRPLRVICGGIVACIGLVVGALVTTPRYHLANTTLADPERMSWGQLIQRGLFDNGHVRLVDVALEPPPQEFVALLDSLQQREAVGDAWEQRIEDPALGSPPRTQFGMVKVMPRGSAIEAVPGRVVVPLVPHIFRAAAAEVEASGTLTGRFQPITRSPFGPEISLLPGLLDQPSALPEEAWYVFVPLDSVPPLSQARGWFLASVAAVAAGLVLAGSGRPTWWTWLVFTFPSALSLLGSPLRRGRSRGEWRLIYGLAGAGLLYYGYRQLTVAGRWWLVDSDPQAMVVGFVIISLGVAACCGSLSSVIMARFRRLRRFRLRLPSTAADALQESAGTTVQRAPRYSRRYFDPRFMIATEVELNAPTQRLTAGFEQLDFESPLVIDVVDDDRVVPSTVQLGCQDLTMAIIETLDEKTRPRLVSVLDDGFVVITMAQEDGESLTGEVGTIEVCPQDDPVLMLSAHLERIAVLAEERGVSLVTLQSNEWRDVYLLAGRVLADIRNRNGESNRCVAEAVHGRFRFPPAPKQPLAGCPS